MVGVTYVDLWRPAVKRRALAYDISLVLGASLLMALLAQIRFILPFSPVPITGQTLGVLLIGTVLGSKRGAIAMGAYLLQGISGLPVFAGGAFGLAYMFGPTGGYLLGFIPAAFVCDLLAEKGMDRHIVTTLLAMVIGTGIIFACGFSWLSAFVGPAQALVLGVYPFILGGALKIGIAGALLPAAWKFVGGRK